MEWGCGDDDDDVLYYELVLYVCNALIGLGLLFIHCILLGDATS